MWNKHDIVTYYLIAKDKEWAVELLALSTNSDKETITEILKDAGVVEC